MTGLELSGNIRFSTYLTWNYDANLKDFKWHVTKWTATSCSIGPVWDEEGGSLFWCLTYQSEGKRTWFLSVLIAEVNQEKRFFLARFRLHLVISFFFFLVHLFYFKTSYFSCLGQRRHERLWRSSMCWHSLSNCSLCTVQLKCMLMKLITAEVKQWHKLFWVASHFQPVCVALTLHLFGVERRCHVELFFGTVWFPDSLTHGSDSLASCAARMSLINRNPQHKRAALSLPGRYHSICSVTQHRNSVASLCVGK